MTMYTWLEKRSRGIGYKFGDYDSVCKSLYSSITPLKFWYDSADNGNSTFGGVFNLEFSPDGSLLVAACEKRSIVLFDANSFKQTKTIKQAHRDCVNCVKFLDDRIFATCSDDCTVVLWDIRNLKSRVRTLCGHSNWVKNIEYSKKDNLIVTSGFDGSIFTWDINSSTEQGLIYNNVFHTSGLMRCRLTPDASKLVICTTGGYLIIIHDLNLHTLAEDLHGFRPNLHRLMQLGRQLIPFATKFQHVFSKSRKRNRVELISDFPEGNDAEVVSSLQIHPQGWCCLSRNISYDESSEWTCVHDIQELENAKDTDDESSDDKNKLLRKAIVTTYAGSNSMTRRRFGRYRSRSISGTTENDNEENTVNFDDLVPDIWEVEVPLINRFVNNRTTNPTSSRLNRVRSGLVPNRNNRHQQQQQQQQSASASSSSTSSTSSLDLNDMNNDFEEDLLPGPQCLGKQNDSSIYHYQYNAKRMLHYIEEPNRGKGFIKELCFNSDGRIICSPYGYGIRLLSFSKDCCELPYCLHPDGKSQPLHEIKIKKCHSDIVVSTKFNPRYPLLVSGCLRGKVVWHQPVF